MSEVSESVRAYLLEAVVAESYRTLTSGTYGLRAREVSHRSPKKYALGVTR